jgi:tRNA pseudouridine13 synthase
MMDHPRAHGAAVLRAAIRSRPEDFRVEEIDAFAASGSGEHLLLTIEKRGMNTAFAAKKIALWAGIPELGVGHAGLKDRHAVTVQRFSVHLPRRVAPDTATLESDDLRVLAAHWHERKLPRGALAGNRFELILRDVAGDREAIEVRWGDICREGVPNYFGEQRFGRQGDNLAEALRMFAGMRVRREQRSILLSAARSHLFNAVLAARVRGASWNRGLDGEVWMLEGSRSVFGPEPWDERLAERLNSGDIHPSGPLWGAGELRTQGPALALEVGVAAGYPEVCAGLAAAGLRQERRALRLPVAGPQLEWTGRDELRLRFRLPPGAYATTVLAELGTAEEAGRPPSGP